jgi:hypothetical protein
MHLNLPDSICSQQDVKNLLLEVREYARWYAHNAIKKRLRLKTKRKLVEQPALSPAASELIHDWSIKKPLSLQSLDELIAALDAFKDTSPSLTIILAAPPTNGLKKTLVSWCRKNIAPDLLINFQFNSTLLGGMVVRSGSRVFDWSFRRQILADRAKFPEVLRRV